MCWSRLTAWKSAFPNGIIIVFLLEFVLLFVVCVCVFIFLFIWYHSKCCLCHSSQWGLCGSYPPCHNSFAMFCWSSICALDFRSAPNLFLLKILSLLLLWAAAFLWPKLFQPLWILIFHTLYNTNICRIFVFFFNFCALFAFHFNSFADFGFGFRISHFCFHEFCICHQFCILLFCFMILCHFMRFAF